MSASIFNGTAVKLLKDILKFKSGHQIITGDTDNPTVVAKAGSPGYMYFRSGTNEVYTKADSGTTTNWTLLSTATAGITQLTGDVTAGPGSGSQAATIANGVITNTQISASAAIARSKVASGTANHVVINDGSGNLSSEAALAISRGGTGQTAKTAAFDALSPNSTKGDLIGFDSTNNVRLAVGTNSQVLSADSTAATGLKWTNVAGVTAPDIQIFTSGSGTYTVPANTRWLHVRMVGGGGGGSGSGTASAGNGTAGGNTTFGSSFLTANGGAGGTAASGTPSTGGSATVGAGATGLAIAGSQGDGSSYYGVGSSGSRGGKGGSSAFGGAGGGGGYGDTGGAAATNSGSGGGGAGIIGSAGNVEGGSGGASGGYVDAFVTSSISATYSYAIGSGGSAGGAGTSGAAGGAGAAGIIIVEAYF